MAVFLWPGETFSTFVLKGGERIKNKLAKRRAWRGRFQHANLPQAQTAILVVYSGKFALAFPG
jgi:hypothetical protein